MTIAKVQHYVPQFLLRNFGSGKKDQVWVYDKSTDRAFLTNAKNVASESRFYDFELEGEAISLEPFLSKIEANAKPIIEKILKADSIKTLLEEERAMLAVFLSIQHTRTRTFREQWVDFPRLLRQHLEAKGNEVVPGSQAADFLQEISDNDSKMQTGKFMLDAAKNFAPHFIEKDWVLVATTSKHPFVLSDNPLTFQNMIDRPNRGNLGLTVPGIEIYLPLSSTRALAMWCVSLTSMIHRGAEQVRGGRSKKFAGQSENFELISMSDALNTGGAILYNASNVENFNSLQVGNCERYIFSNQDEFELPRDMLRTHPNLKGGPRMRTAR